MDSKLTTLQTPGNPASVMAVPTTPAAPLPDGVAEGIYFVVTHWLGPIAQNLIEWAATVLIVEGFRTFEKKVKGTGPDIVGAYNDLLRVLQGQSDTYGVPLQGTLAPSDSSISALIATLGTL